MSGRFADAVRRRQIAGRRQGEQRAARARGPFSLYIRAYCAGSAIVDGQWRPLIVRRVQQAANDGVRDVVPRCER